MRRFWLHAALAALAAAGATACSKEIEVPIPEPAPVVMTWEGLHIDTAENPQWCLSRSNSWVAMTDYPSRSQLQLQWEGGMSNGPKSDARLRIALSGSRPTEYPLSDCRLTADGVNCTITFTGPNKEAGSITFPL